MARLHVVQRATDEFTDEQIERLMDFGRREADLLDQLENAVRGGDRDLCWQLAQTLVECRDQAQELPPPAA